MAKGELPVRVTATPPIRVPPSAGAASRRGEVFSKDAATTVKEARLPTVASEMRLKVPFNTKISAVRLPLPDTDTAVRAAGAVTQLVK